MKIDSATSNKLKRDLLVSLFIYALPVVLMFLYFLLSGQRPWENWKQPVSTPSTIFK